MLNSANGLEAADLFLDFMFISLLGISKLEAVSIVLFSFGGWNNGKRAVDWHLLFLIFWREENRVIARP